MYSSCQRGHHGKAYGKKKSDGERKKKERIKNCGESEDLKELFKPRRLPLSPQNSYCPQNSGCGVKA
jgi:hypothetical protein